MIKTISSIALASLVALTITGCGAQPEPEEADFRCKQENVLAPKWTCIPMADDAYAGVGIAMNSKAGQAMMRRVAIANGRSDLAQQIKTIVKDKITVYTGTTGVGADETVDQATEAVTKQVAKVDLTGSKAIESWNAPSGALYMLVTVSEQETNKQIKENLKTSINNDKALWQQFKAKNALEDLEKEFATE